jgi:hypothetical protein
LIAASIEADLLSFMQLAAAFAESSLEANVWRWRGGSAGAGCDAIDEAAEG